MTAAIDIRSVSKWYGNVVAVNDVSLQVEPGITGLLGPNGAGKTTLLHMIAGLASPSEGEVLMLGEPVRDNPPLYRRMGFMPEHEAIYEMLTGRRFVELTADLHGLDPTGPPVDRALELVGLSEAQDRPTGTYSRGMRQRARMAAALVNDPEVLLLDEPLSGTDPRQRIQIQDVMTRMASQGRTVLVSSHILEEVEVIADNILLMVAGKLAAAGDYVAIRAKLDEQPYQVRVVSGDSRAMAAVLIGLDAVGSSHDRRRFLTDSSDRQHSRDAALSSRLAMERGIRLYRMESLDESLESVFGYLVEGR